MEYHTELAIYQANTDFPYMPMLLNYGDKTLELEFIPGPTLFQAPIDHWVFLSYTLSQFHNQTYDPENKTAIIHYDTNLNNYILSDGIIYMVDFSEIQIDHPLVDIYSILLFCCENIHPDKFKTFYESFWGIYQENLTIQIPHDKKILSNEIKRFENRRTFYKKGIKNLEWYRKNKKEL